MQIQTYRQTHTWTRSPQRFSWHPFRCAVCHSKPRVLWMEIRKSRMGAFLTSYAHALLHCNLTRPRASRPKKTEREDVFSFESYSRFQTFQFHWEIFNSIVCILMRGVQWALWFVTSSWSECLSDQLFAAKLSARWAPKRRLISNDRHGVISFLILANKPSSFS